MPRYEPVPRTVRLEAAGFGDPAQEALGAVVLGIGQEFGWPGLLDELSVGQIYGAGVDLADPVAVDRRCDVAEQPGQLRLW